MAVQAYEPDGTITFWNRGSELLYGFPASTVLGRSILELLHTPEAREAERRVMDEALRTGILAPASEVEVVRADGQSVTVFASRILAPRPDSGPEFFCFDIDITERKQAENVLRQSEQHHRSLFESMQEGFALHEIICDAAGRPCDYRYLEVNPAFERATGIPRERWIGHTVREVLPSVEEYWIQGFGAVALTGRPATFDNYVRELDRHYEVVAYSPGHGLFAVIALDVSARKRTEQALRASEENLRETARIARVGGWEIDFNGGTISWTEETFRIYEMEVGRPLSVAEAIQHYHPDDRARVTEAVERAVQQGTRFDIEARLITARKNLVWVRAIGAAVYHEGRPVAIRGMVQDITDRKQAEETLQARERRFSELIQNSFDTIAILDRDGIQQYVSPSAERVHGYSPAELVGIPVIDQMIHPEDRDHVLAAFRQILETGRGGAQYRHRCKGGGWVHLEASGTNQLDNPDIRGVVVNVRDITERKRADEEREHLQAQLTQSQKMESVGRLAGGVAHDFNNMLQAILGNAGLALDEVRSEGPLRECLLEIQKCAQRSADLTRQLLAFARKQTIAPRVLDLNETVTGMLKMLRRLIGEQIELAWSPGADVGCVHMDPSQVDQILANLCVNARDAIGDGTGRVTIETASVRFDEAYVAEHPGARVGVFLRVTVRDTGCGMSPDVRDHLFEPFFTTKGLGKGTGLGLAMVYGIVEQNHGFISVETEVGRGTSVQIHLPRHEVRAGGPTDDSAASGPRAGTETILLVEDEPAILRVGQRLLETLGYRVLPARTPGEAMRLAREHVGEIHMLMTDVVMPEMNGRDLAKNLLSHYPNLKRLFMSGYTADVIAHHGVLEPGVHFLQKPFTVEALAQKVREVLSA